MNWIKKMLDKALNNSSIRKIQLQFLGILFIAVVSVIGYKFYSASWSINTVLISSIVAALIFGIIYIIPIILKPLLLIWLLFGLLLGEITSTIILAFIFYFIFFPITFTLRIINRKKKAHQPQWLSREKDSVNYKKLY